jgi:hypothetical protein
MERDGFHIFTQRYALSRVEKLALIAGTILRLRFG